jgi:ATP-dependent DNA ligase
MKTVSINDLAKEYSKGLIVTAKLNGDFNVFHYIRGVGAYSINRYGTIRGRNYPHVKEFYDSMEKKSGVNSAIMLGETYSVSDGKMDNLPTFIHKIRSNDENLLGDINVAMFDLISVDNHKILGPYDFKLDEMSRWIDGEKVKTVPYIAAKSEDDVMQFWEKWVKSGDYEGLVARDSTGNIYKVKPEKTVDAVMIGINKTPSLKDGVVSSIKAALMTPDGKFVKISDATVTDSKLKRALFEFHKSRIIREDNDTVYIKPEVVFEIKYIDELKSIRTLYDKNLEPVGNMEFVSLVSPRILRLRSDKRVTPQDLRLEQVAKKW